LPFLGPPLAGAAAAGVGLGLDGGLGACLLAALFAGFAPIALNALWKWRLRRGDQ
jgi:hypothetical protein